MLRAYTNKLISGCGGSGVVNSLLYGNAINGSFIFTKNQQQQQQQQLSQYRYFTSTTDKPASPTSATPTTPLDKNNILTDTFNRKHTYLRISLTEKCNLRCQYCMPEEGVELAPNDKILTDDEILRISRLFASAGVTKIRFTGGEPLIRKNIESLIEQVGKIEGIEKIGITTNGLVLHRKLERLQKGGVNLLNISLDTLDTHKFTLITRRLGWEKVMESINKALSLNFNPVKINCVVMKNINDMEICDFVEMTREKNVEIRFIEYMPFGGNKWSDKKFVSYTDMIKMIKEKFGALDRCVDEANNTSKTYQVPGFKGRVGFITSMSEHFCSSCNRLRMTADGNLKVCLFGNTEVSLRDIMRSGASDEEILKVINQAVLKKKASHAVVEGLVLCFVNLSNTITSKLGVATAAMSSALFPSVTPNPLPSMRSYSTFNSGGVHNNNNNNNNNPFSHVNSTSNMPTMVDVSAKVPTKRTAHARTIVEFPTDVLQQLLGSDRKEISSKKGPVFATSIVAGTMAVKNTSNMIPFCHPLGIEAIKIDIAVISDAQVQVDCTVSVFSKTGVEMEALVGASLTSLCIYDMCKALSHDIVLKETKLISKKGGKSDVGEK
ncbi:hypothetical protein CYY_004713 [Polysphondylium violaceum]|uniref:Molybdenum cofactor biosynthesis protein 1 n=1 Tax=Polysphondylium violaceum TaxID=133409 RepID=A0A8J4PSX2_9MYCE|nr:hypothetical protein CYY_004713 [Polysphondylium violaceum]